MDFADILILVENPDWLSQNPGWLSQNPRGIISKIRNPIPERKETSKKRFLTRFHDIGILGDDVFFL